MSIQSLLNVGIAGGGGRDTDSSDAYFKQTPLLLRGGGTTGAQNNTFLDSSSNGATVTRVGDTTQGSFSPFAASEGNWSLVGNDGYSYAGAAAGLQSAFAGWGGRTRTIECWVYRKNDSDFMIQGAYAAVAANGRWWVGSSSGYLRMQYTTGTGSETGVSSSNTIPTNRWVHIAVCVNSSTSTNTTIYLCVDGTVTTSTGNNLSTQTSSYGWNNMFSGGQYQPSQIQGFYNNLRWSNNIRYTSNFTPPTSNFTTDGNTLFLHSGTRAFNDSSGNGYHPTSSNFHMVPVAPFFNPTTAYAPATQGGSAYFDGTGDQLTIPNTSSGFTFGTGSFTIELWLYCISDGSIINYSNGQSSNSNFGLEIGTSGSNINGSIIEGTTQYMSTYTSFTKYGWNHVALVRNGNSLNIYVNGVAGSTVTVTGVTVNDPSGATMRLGGYTNNTGMSSGYISNLRIAKGVAVYTGAFTPPTAPVTATTGGTVPPNASQTVALLNFTNSGIFDNAMRTVLTSQGNVQISTSVKKYGTGSIKFDGTDDCLAFPGNTDFDFGSKDFTIEFWVYMTVAPTTESYFMSVGPAGSGGVYRGWRLSAHNGTSTGIWFYPTNAASETKLGDLPSLNAWHHIAIVRSGTTITGYVDGVALGTTMSVSTSTINSLSYSDWSFIGGISNTVGTSSARYFFAGGYMDDIRFTRGYARYTTTFTPPTQALPTYGS